MASTTSTTWAEISKGDDVLLQGKRFTVTKIKAKGKRARLVVVGQGGRFESEVRLKDEVTIAPAKTKGRDKGRAREEWHTPSKAQRKEQRQALERPGLPPGDPTATKPGKLSDTPWETRRDKVEAKLDKLLGAVLVGESTDEAQGWYVPPVDATTVAAHWMVFHNGDDWELSGEAELLDRHEREHENRAPLKVNHWHTETRPKAGK